MTNAKEIRRENLRSAVESLAYRARVNGLDAEAKKILQDHDYDPNGGMPRFKIDAIIRRLSNLLNR